MFPLRGLWRRAPAEGDFYITCEVDWQVSPPAKCVQFSVSGNSPVALSQIAALAVDNSRSGADVDFIFSDSGFILTVPAHNQLVAPVMTNGLVFYANSQGSQVGDVTTFQILNSIPPPIMIAPSVEQNSASVSGVGLANATTPVIAAGVSGTLNTLSGSVSIINASADPETAQIFLTDGTGKQLWETFVVVGADQTQSTPINLSGLSVRFTDGVNVVVANSTVAAGQGNIVLSLFYSTP